ncbi:MAG: hypothetical protein ACQEP3_03465 [Patescibacteria group bacterium]
MSNKKGKKIGDIIHYFGDLKVAIIKLSENLEVGDEVRIIGGEDTDFNQEIKSMEIDREKIEKASSGQEVGVQVKEKVRKGYEVYEA